MTERSSLLDQLLQIHGLDLKSPPSAEKWQSVLQVLRAQLEGAAAGEWPLPLTDLQWPTFITGVDGVLQSWNQGCQRLLGYGSEVLGQRVQHLLSTPLEGLRLEGLLREALQGERLLGVELPFLHQDGSLCLTVCSLALSPATVEREAGLVFTCVPLPGGEHPWPAATSGDETGPLSPAARPPAGRKHDSRQHFYESLLHTLPAPLAILDAQGRYVFCNEGSIRNQEIREWIIGKTDEEYWAYRQFDPHMLERRKAHYHQAVQERRSVTFEEVFDRPGGGQVVQARTYTPVFDNTGKLSMVLGYGLEITELRAAQAALETLNSELEARVTARTAQLEAANRQIQHDAFHDALTGLPNRALFMDRLAQAISRSRQLGRPTYAVLLLDTDRFKAVNDTLGHPAGDALLRELATRLRAVVRASDTVARQGGDEFTILLEPTLTGEQVTALAQRIQEVVREPIYVHGEQVSVSVSLGIVLGNQEYAAASEVLRDADIAMYRAKAAGRGGNQIFHQQMREQTIHEGRLEQELRAALLRDELRLVYQPIIELSTGRVAGFEALVRWQHPRRGLLAPGQFLPVAGESGLSQEIDRWVLHRACLDMGLWQQQHPRARALTISVNFNAELFSAPDTLDFLREVLHETDFDPARLHIEITEGVLLGQPQAISETLKGVQALGVKLHLDDFGTGYSSLSYLHHYPLDTLKIDRSFVLSMLENRSSAELVRTIVAMTKNMNMTAVAEGVENQEQLATLQALGCEFAQGYFFSPPLPLPEVCEVVAALDAQVDSSASRQP